MRAPAVDAREVAPGTSIARTPRVFARAGRVPIPFGRIVLGRPLRVLGLLLGLSGAGTAGGCHKGEVAKPSEPAPDGEAIKKSLAGLRTQLAALEANFGGLRKQIETVPQDLAGFREVRAKFFATEEARGITDVKVTLLSNRLDAALAARKNDDLAKVAQDVEATNGELQQFNQLYVTQLHQVMTYQRVVERQKKEAEAAAEGAAAVAAAKKKHGADKHGKSKP